MGFFLYSVLINNAIYSQPMKMVFSLSYDLLREWQYQAKCAFRHARHQRCKYPNLC